ncbi:MAG: hypothetical protein H0W72_14055 [Planctomycetes bacterium]|nr:hypothetical protein [Planctomycetota bacterium]
MAPLAATEVADALARGGLVAVHTAQGWLALARASERGRLLGLAGVSAQRIALTGGDTALLGEFLPPHGLRARILLNRLLPGAVAISVAAEAPPVRLPDHPLWPTLRSLRTPLLAVPLPTSDAPATRWPELSIVAGDGVPQAGESEVVVHAGKALKVITSAGPSTEAIFDAARLHLLCVCSGNTCRSPMLSVLLRHHLLSRGMPEVRVESAGAMAAEGNPASDHARTAMTARGLSLDSHRSRPIDELELGLYDRFLCMTTAHAAFLRQYGIPDERLCVVNADAGGVPDPYGGDQERYDRCAETLERAVVAIVDGL